MSACLKGEMPKDEAKVTPQQQRMRDCNEQAGKQQFPSGRERQAFMQKCLRAD
jgi:cytochrome c556